MPVRKRKQKSLRISNFALSLVVFKWHHGNEGAKSFQIWHLSWSFSEWQSGKHGNVRVNCARCEPVVSGTRTVTGHITDECWLHWQPTRSIYRLKALLQEDNECRSRTDQSSRVQELCESRGGRPGFPILMSLTVSVDVKQHWIMLTHCWQFVPNMSARHPRVLSSTSSSSGTDLHSTEIRFSLSWTIQQQ